MIYLALRTDILKFDHRTIRSKLRQQPRYTFIQLFQTFMMQITNRSADLAANVMMRRRIAVKTLLTTSRLQLLYHSAFRKLLQIPVNRSKTDLRHALLYYVIQLVSRRMTGKLAQLFTDRLPLNCFVHNPTTSLYINLLKMIIITVNIIFDKEITNLICQI